MTGIVCSMVGATFGVAAAATIIRSKKSISANGNAQVSTTQSKFGGSSLLLDGTGDYLYIPSYTDFAYGTGDFTIEMWVRFTSQPSAGSYRVFYDQRPTSTNGAYPVLTQKGTAIVYYANSTDAITSSALSTGVWYHLALSRSGTSTKMFIDGTQAGTTYTDSTTYLTSNTYVGGDSFSTTSQFDGNLDELRVSKTARYTTTFTPSTTAFVNDDNTVLLLHMNGTNASTFFEDDNGVRAQKGITANGNAAISTTQSKFGGTSAYFDGTGDGLTVNHDGSMRFGTGDFTMEFWYRPTSRVQTYPVVFTNKNGFSAGNIVFHDRHASYNTKLTVWIYNLSSGAPIFTSTTTTVDGTWYHIALSRSGTNLRFFINGTQEGSTYNVSTNNIDTGATTEPYYISYPGSSSEFNGYVDEVRVSNTARYTANFTAPTAPFTNDSSTLLLMHMDGTDASTVFRDDNGYGPRQQKHISYYGNAQLDTAQSKFGGTSALFDATGDYLVLPASELTFGTGNWTIEGWYKSSVTSGDQYLINFKVPTSQISGIADIDSGNGHWGINIYQGNWRAGAFNNKLVGGVGSGVNTGIDTTTWHHFALVRDSSTTLKYYIDGTQIGSTVTLSATDNFTSSIAYLGSFYFSTSNTSWNGWLDEIRISNTARYTTTFTPSTTPFTNDANTMLLLHMNGADAATTFYDDNGGRSQKGIQAIGNAQIDTAQSKFGGSSALFDGTDDYLSIAATSDFAFHNKSWTIEGWVNTSWALYDRIFDFSSAVCNIGFGNATGQIGFYPGYGGTYLLQSGNVWTNSQWNHLAVTGNYNGSTHTITIWYNGTSVATTSGITLTSTSTQAMTIGAAVGMTDDFGSGWIDEVRISNTARYTANFTPSTTPFTNDANTLLLMHMDGTDGSTVFIDDNGIADHTA